MNTQNVIDSIDLDSRDGFDIRADLVPDIDPANASDLDFVGIIVTASRHGVTLGSDTLWGITHGIIDPLRDKRGTFAVYRADMIDNAVADARLKLTELIDAAIDGSIQ